MSSRVLIALLAPLTLSAGLSLSAAAQPPTAGDAEALAVRLQRRYDAIRSFRAAFSHTYEGGVLRRRTTETGTVEIKKPGRMRWEYEKPERKLFVSDGRKLYAYVPADRQVTITTLPAEDEAATPALFLMGRGNLRRDFTVSLASTVPGAPADSVALVLVPKTTVPDYEHLTMVVDRETLALRMLVTRDAQGGTSTFTFTNLRENVPLADSRFTFTIPRGADVVTQN